MIEQPTTETPDAEVSAPDPPQMGVQITTNGLILTLPITLHLPEEAVNQVVRQWIATHPALADELIEQHIAGLKMKQQLMQDIKRSRNDEH